MNAKRKSNTKKFPKADASLADWARWHHHNGETIGGYWVKPIRPGKKAAYQKDWTKKPLKTLQAVERHWKKNPDDNI